MTPEKLEEYVYDNNIITLYNKVNASIIAQIIDRISVLGNITESSKYQLQKVIDLYGQEIFNKALEETSLLTAQTKKELEKIFEQMIKDDLTSYKQLFEINGNELVLNSAQTKILEQGISETGEFFTNLTKTYAFKSQQLYVDTVDRVFLEVQTGAVDYTTSIVNAYRELTEKGVTLNDSIGRNVQIDVAIRRNLMSGIQKTANNVNKKIEEDLGCDGYETTAHSGARPSHAKWQGHQFALTKEDGEKYNLDLWTDKKWDKKSVEEELNDYNCRHTYFGIILGTSKSMYTDEELKTFENETIDYQGEKISKYEATQKQRVIENNLRKSKKSVANTEESLKVASELENDKLTSILKEQKLMMDNWATRYTQFNKETGLTSQISRTKI